MFGLLWLFLHRCQAKPQPAAQHTAGIHYALWLLRGLYAGNVVWRPSPIGWRPSLLARGPAGGLCAKSNVLTNTDPVLGIPPNGGTAAHSF